MAGKERDVPSVAPGAKKGSAEAMNDVVETEAAAPAAIQAPSDGERFEEFVRLVSSLEKEITRIRATECERLGLRGADLMCLYRLGSNAAPMTAAELAKTSGLTRGAVSRTVSNLAELGLAEVHEGEGAARRYRAGVVLTPRGREVMDGVNAAVSRVMGCVDSALDADARATLYASLASVLERLRGIDR